MENLSILEEALTLWAQETIKHILHPTYIGLMRLLIAELPRFPQLGSQFAEAVPQQGGAFLREILESARQHGVIVGDDPDLGGRLLVGSLLTYVLNGLLTSDGGLACASARAHHCTRSAGPSGSCLSSVGREQPWTS